MRSFGGEVIETNDLGVVAENCPYCDRLTSCLLRTVSRGNYVFFVKMAELSRESSCMCTDCLKTFPGKPNWSYAGVVPIREASSMELDDLLTKTNPILADRIHFKEQIRELGGDDRFAVAFDNVDGMRPGPLRSDLMRKLVDWPSMGETQRTELSEHIGALSHAWKFARQMAFGFPVSSGFLPFVAAAMMVGLVLIYAFERQNWSWTAVALGAGVVATLVAETILFKRQIRRWTTQVLIPEAQAANVPLERFIAVVDDIPGRKLPVKDDLWPVKDQLENIRQILISEGKLGRAPKSESHIAETSPPPQKTDLDSP